MLEPYEGKLSRAVLRGEGGSNTPDLPDDYYGQLAERERRPIEARKKVRSTRTLSTHVRTVWDQSGLQLLTGWFESICALMSRSSNGEGNGLLSHPCGFDSCTRHSCFARSTEKDSSLLSRRCGFKSRAKHYGYVAKRLCSGLLTRQTQVRPLSCPFNGLMM